VELYRSRTFHGWINCYGHFYRSALWTLHRIDAYLIRWARNKFKRLRSLPRGVREWFASDGQWSWHCHQQGQGGDLALQEQFGREGVSGLWRDKR